MLKYYVFATESFYHGSHCGIWSDFDHFMFNLFSFSQITMNGERLLFTLPSMYFLYMTIAAATRCVQYKFLKEPDMSLENHVMKSIPDILPYACRSLCVDTTFCFSINMKTKQGSNYVTCELNNSTRIADPQDVKSETGSEYHQMAVRALNFCFCFCFFFKYNYTHFFHFWQLTWKLMKIKCEELPNTGSKRNDCNAWLHEMIGSLKHISVTI